MVKLADEINYGLRCPSSAFFRFRTWQISKISPQQSFTIRDLDLQLDGGQLFRLTEADIAHDPQRAASDPRYAQDVRAVDADTPARFNADPSRLFEASGSAGKLCLFAVRLDTFPKEPSTVFYLGSNAPDDLTAVRRHLLTALPRLPIAGEYIHRTAYDIGEKYGKDTFLLIDRFGTARVPAAFALKSRVDGFLERLACAA